MQNFYLFPKFHVLVSEKQALLLDFANLRKGKNTFSRKWVRAGKNVLVGSGRTRNELKIYLSDLEISPND